VDFKQALAAAIGDLRRAPDLGPGRLQDISFRARRDGATPPRGDGNNVDIDREMAGLARNALHHRAASEALALRIRMLRTAIREGRH